MACWICWISNKVNKIRDNLSHRHPKLPDFPLADEGFPFQIGKNISVKEYNDFLDRNESSGYKFHFDKKNVYIIEMARAPREDVISYLQDYFKDPNNRVKLGPIIVSGQPFHYNPVGIGEKIAPDISVRPRESLVLRANPYPDFPRGDFERNSHARIICEVANTQKIDLWNTKCETWMHEEYVRCVFGIKIYPKINIKRIVHQPIIVWVRRALPGGVLSSNATLTGNGIYVKEWECGTVYHDTHTPTGCNAPNNDEFQVTIPVRDVFWDPPIVGGAPNVEDYTAVVPDTVVGENFVIDLYNIQQGVLNVY